MKRTAKNIGDAVSRLKIKLLGFLLSVLGPAAFNSCGLYMPPAALYAPPPGDYVRISGKVTNAAYGQAIGDIQVSAYATIDGEDRLLESVTSVADGSYELAMYVNANSSIRLVASDIDDEKNGSYEEKSLAAVATANIDDDIGEIQKTQDIALTQKPDSSGGK
jgi:putative lipoprotein (rSAM/lipoprotein system)